MTQKTGTGCLAQVIAIVALFPAYAFLTSDHPFTKYNYKSNQFEFDPTFLIWIILIAAFLFLMIKLSKASTDTHNIPIIIDRDDSARRIYSDIVNGRQIENYYVFLRPFSITGKTVTDLPSETPGTIQYHTSLEETLANSLANDGTLIGLSGPGEDIGAGTIPSSDDEWKNKVSLLLSYCIHVYMIPGYQEGVLWEIDYLVKNNMLEKCTFILPILSDKNSRLSFDVTARMFSERKLMFPKVHNQSIIFTLDNNGNIMHEEAAHLESTNHKRMRKLLDNLNQQVLTKKRIRNADAKKQLLK